jgi:hypothetical protein
LDGMLPPIVRSSSDLFYEGLDIHPHATCASAASAWDSQQVMSDVLQPIGEISACFGR